MMTYQEAKDFTSRYEAALRRLSKMRRDRLAELLADQDRADGRTRLVGGPRTKDEYLSELLNRDYTVDQRNEAIHVLHHAPTARWPGCEHCQAKPQTQTVNTGDLLPGDIVLDRGMRVRVDEIREHQADGAAPGTRAWTCPGTVINLAEVLDAKVIPPQFLESYGYSDSWHVLRHDAWTIHGDAGHLWTVELPRPAKPQRQPAPGPACSTPALHATERCMCAGITRTDTAAAEQAAADRQQAQR